MDRKAEDVLANMEQLGVQTVREMVSSGRWPANYSALAKAWLHQKDIEQRERENPHKPDPVFIAQRSNELARSARDTALGANDLAEDVKKLAEDANAKAWEAVSIAQSASASAEGSVAAALKYSMIAKTALAAALVAIVISIASFLFIFMR